MDGLLLLSLCVDALAAADNINVLDGIVRKIQNTTPHMAAKLVGFATALFWSLAVIQMVWTFGRLALRKAETGDFFSQLVRLTITLGFFWWLLSNAVTGMNIAAGTIVDSMRDMGAQVIVLEQQLTPPNIVDVGFSPLKKVMDAKLRIAKTIVAYSVAIMVLLIFASIGINMVLVLAKSWFLPYGSLTGLVLQRTPRQSQAARSGYLVALLRPQHRTDSQVGRMQCGPG